MDATWAYDHFLNQRALQSADSVRSQLVRGCSLQLLRLPWWC